MKTISRSLTYACGAAAALLLAGAATAATHGSQAQQRYERERAVCMSGASNQDRATCLREAGAAYQEARRGSLAGGNDAELARNRSVRCNALPAQDRQDCEMRMQGQGVTTGSAQQGGVLRELTRPVPSN